MENKEINYQQAIEIINRIDAERLDLTEQDHEFLKNAAAKIVAIERSARREALYIDYYRELEKYSPHMRENECSDEEIKKQARDLMPGGELGSCSEWIDIVRDGKIVGFLIMSSAPKCHPETDFFINQKYVMPEYRKGGLMSDTIRGFMKKHPKSRYSIFILRKNKWAQTYWKTFFKSVGYTTVPLLKMDEFKSENPDEKLVGFEPDKAYFRN